MEQSFVFDWDNFAPFIVHIFRADEDQIDILESPSGSVYTYKRNTAPFLGRFTFFDFGASMRATICEGKSEEDISLSMVDGDWVRFNFALSIHVSMDGIQNTPVELTTPSWRIIDHPRDKLTTELLTKGSESRWLTIICKPSEIKRLTGRELDDLPEFFRFVDASQDRSTQYRDFVLRSRFASITTDVLRSDIEGPLNIAYIKARCTELLCLALEDLIDPIDSDGLPALNETESARILAAKAYIDEHFQEGPSVKQVSAVAGLNRNSLFYGFKRKFGLSVSEYVQERRLEKAKLLLEHSDKNLIDIAEEVGFRHQSSFITAFRKRFGTTPGKLRRGD